MLSILLEKKTTLVLQKQNVDITHHKKGFQKTETLFLYYSMVNDNL